MQGRRRVGARHLAAGAAVVVACALVLSGCTAPAPKPMPECRDVAEAGDAGQPELQDYGLWSQTWDSPPGAGNLDRPAPLPFGFDPERKVWLTSIMLAPGVNGRVSIVTPRNARLFVASNWDRMGSLTAVDLRLRATRSVDLVGCDGIAFYPGLVIVDGPECVVFAVQREGENRVAQISVPYFGAECWYPSSAGSLRRTSVLSASAPVEKSSPRISHNSGRQRFDFERIKSCHPSHT